MAPARTDDEEPTVEQVERIGARRLAEIVVNHCYRDEGLRQAVRIALAALAPGDPLVETLAAEIDAIRADRHYLLDAATRRRAPGGKSPARRHPALSPDGRCRSAPRSLAAL